MFAIFNDLLNYVGGDTSLATCLAITDIILLHRYYRYLASDRKCRQTLEAKGPYTPGRISARVIRQRFSMRFFVFTPQTFYLTTSIRFLTLSIRFWNRNRFSIPNPIRCVYVIVQCWQKRKSALLSHRKRLRTHIGYSFFFFRYPITIKKYINNASKNASCYEAIFVIINTN